MATFPPAIESRLYGKEYQRAECQNTKVNANPHSKPIIKHICISTLVRATIKLAASSRIDEKLLVPIVRSHQTVNPCESVLCPLVQMLLRMNLQC
jgi:hypothetical protein